MIAQKSRTTDDTCENGFAYIFSTSQLLILACVAKVHPPARYMRCKQLAWNARDNGSHC